MANNKRTLENIDARLDALRSKLPKTKTTLQKYIDEFNQYDVTPLSKQTWKEAKQCMDKLRKECIRCHASDIWMVKEVTDALLPKVKEFRIAAMQHSIDVCFDMLEKHVQNKVMVKPYFKREAMTVAQYESQKGSYKTNSDAFVNFLPSEFDDGVRYDVIFLEHYASFEYFAPDATNEEMDSPTYPSRTTRVKKDLEDYLDICLIYPRVHRKDSLFVAIFDILEKHIRTLKELLDDIEHHTFERMVSDLHGFVC